MKDLRFVSVLIADDHPILCEGLKSFVHHDRGLRVVTEANSWPQAVAKAILYRPGLAILDLHMPGMQAMDAIPVIRQKSPETRIIILSAFAGDEEVFRVLQAGAIGYLPKNAEIESFRECISAVREEKTWVHPSAAAKLTDRMQTKDITSRESEVLQLVALGKSNKEIGAFLGVTEGTVKVHINHLFAKLGVDGRVAATMLALQRGFVHLPQVRDSGADGLVSREKRRAS